MAARRKKAGALCAEHFPYGLADQPADATVVSCEHDSWDVADLKPADPPPPPGGDGKGPEGDGKGDGDGTGGGE